jgi:two-component system sensor histidine kinase AlgZ
MSSEPLDSIEPPLGRPMSSARHQSAPFQPTATRPGSLFGPTLAGPETLAPGREREATFDICHVGLVLRTVLFVQLVLALGVLFVVDSFAAWLLQVAVSMGVALPGTLFWLVVACSLKRWLARIPRLAQWLAAAVLGAVSGAFGWTLGHWSGLDLFDNHLWLAPLMCGAGLAVIVTLWLQLRAQAQLPADTTARLAELQSRIRPHFLFNTLNTALSLVRLNPAQAEDVLEDLAELFRVALTDMSEAVTLAEEVELARRYLAIEQIRFGSRLEVIWELSADAGAARVPPLLLQPLVENAVRHGVEPSAEGGVVRIRTRARLGRVQISIANTVPDAPSNPGHGMALHNVRERLRLMHDVAAQFEARLDKKVFRVQIGVPL